MAAKRTTHRSSAGKKLYAVRDSEGKFKDIQSYSRAHAADIARTSASEVEESSSKKKATKKKKAAKPKAAKKAAKKKVAKKKAAKKK